MFTYMALFKMTILYYTVCRWMLGYLIVLISSELSFTCCSLDVHVVEVLGVAQDSVIRTKFNFLIINLYSVVLPPVHTCLCPLC